MCVYILWCKFTNFRWKDKDFYYLSSVLWLVLAYFFLCAVMCLCCMDTKKRTSKNTCPLLLEWALTDSNRRPSACKADALNQLS